MTDCEAERFFLLQAFRSHCKGIIHMQLSNDKGLDPEGPLRLAFGTPTPVSKSTPSPVVSSSSSLAEALKNFQLMSQSGPLASYLAGNTQQTAAQPAVQPQEEQQPPKQPTYYCSSCHIGFSSRDVSWYQCATFNCKACHFSNVGIMIQLQMQVLRFHL